MTVTEYNQTFSDMSRYAPELVDTDLKMVERFRAGLRHEICMTLASHRRLSYSETLDRALDIEEAIPKEETTAPTSAILPMPPHQANYRDKRKFEGNQAPYGNKCHHYTPYQSQNYHRQDMKHRGNQQRMPHCTQCSKYHFEECRNGGIRCFTCQGTGHMSRECPNTKGVPRIWQGPRLQQPQPIRQVAPWQARAYVLEGSQGQEQYGNKDKDHLAGNEYVSTTIYHRVV